MHIKMICFSNHSKQIVTSFNIACNCFHQTIPLSAFVLDTKLMAWLQVHNTEVWDRHVNNCTQNMERSRMDSKIVGLEASSLTYVSQLKELVTSWSYHVIITTNFFMWTEWLNDWREYTGGERRCGGVDPWHLFLWSQYTWGSVIGRSCVLNPKMFLVKRLMCISHWTCTLHHSS
jgi:hypothetical protein